MSETEKKILNRIVESSDPLSPYTLKDQLNLSYTGVARGCRTLEGKNFLASENVEGMRGSIKILYRVSLAGFFCYLYLNRDDDYPYKGDYSTFYNITEISKIEITKTSIIPTLQGHQHLDSTISQIVGLCKNLEESVLKEDNKSLVLRPSTVIFDWLYSTILSLGEELIGFQNLLSDPHSISDRLHKGIVYRVLDNVEHNTNLKAAELLFSSIPKGTELHYLLLQRVYDVLEYHLSDIDNLLTFINDEEILSELRKIDYKRIITKAIQISDEFSNKQKMMQI